MVLINWNNIYVCQQFGLSKKQSRDCLIRLENLGVIRRVLRNVQFSTGMRNNILYIELVPSVLKKITYSDTNSIDVVKKSTPTMFGWGGSFTLSKFLGFYFLKCVLNDE